MKYIIQHLIFPNPLVCDEEEMYFRRRGNVLQYKNIIQFEKNASCSFSTYFNSFSLNKWLCYTKLDNLNLTLCLQGTFLIKIYSAYWCHEQVINFCIGEYKMDSKEKKECDFSIDISQNDNVYFELTACSQDAYLYDGYYYTEMKDEQLNIVNIDLVMCTFKREKYIKRNIDLIVHDFLQVKKFNGSQHIKIKVVDNGQTLNPKELEIPNLVEIYPNLNVGGSGGFCRGMIESLHDETTTHILFMDDDVLIQVEALERTFNLLSLLKNQYKNDFIGGAMFRLDRKNIQHENLAGFKGDYLLSLKQNLNMNVFSNVLYNDKLETIKNVYAAWWFCCIPKTVANLKNLPYPFFIRMDDIEYSIRNIKNAISLNGISVWHEAFDKKYSTLMENYFMFRNNLVTNMIYGTIGKKKNFKFLFRRFAREIFRYDYGGAELLLDGVENLLKGPDFYKNVDTVADLKIHAVKQAKFVSVKNIKICDMLYKKFISDSMNFQESKIKRAIRHITWNGHFLPNFIFKSVGFANYGYGDRSQMYFCRKTVIACDSNFETAAKMKINRLRCMKLIFRWVKLSFHFIYKYNQLENSYKKAFPEMVSEKFWYKYLKK